MALLCAHLFDFYLGDARQLRARVARVLPEWPEADPLQPFVLGMYAFGLEECNLYAEAEAAGVKSVPALVVGGQTLHLNFGAPMSALK